jgi:hypothetical protein
MEFFQILDEFVYNIDKLEENKSSPNVLKTT